MPAGSSPGTCYAWAVGVIPVDDRTFVQAMQEANTVIANPAFLAFFVGAPLCAGLAVVTTRMSSYGLYDVRL